MVSRARLLAHLSLACSVALGGCGLPPLQSAGGAVHVSTPSTGLQKVNGGGGIELAIYAAVGAFYVAVAAIGVTIDLLILPAAPIIELCGGDGLDWVFPLCRGVFVDKKKAADAEAATREAQAAPDPAPRAARPAQPRSARPAKRSVRPVRRPGSRTRTGAPGRNGQLDPTDFAPDNRMSRW